MNEYYNVYTSYMKQRRSHYNTSMGAFGYHEGWAFKYYDVYTCTESEEEI